MQKALAILAMLVTGAAVAVAQCPGGAAPGAGDCHPGGMKARNCDMPGMGGQHHSGTGRGMMGCSRANCCTSPEMAKELGLSEDQVRKIDALVSKHRTAMIKIGADLKIACLEMQDLMGSSAGDSEIKGKAKAVSTLRQKIEEARLTHVLDCRKILTAEQQKKMKTACGPMHGRGMMGGCHSGQDCHR